MANSHSYINAPTVHIAPQTLRGYRNRAWESYPTEWLELFWGWREASHLYIVTSVAVPSKAGKDWWAYESVEAEELAMAEAKEHKLAVVGSIHSHPITKDEPGYMTEVNRHASRCDHEQSAAAGELVCAIFVPYHSENGRRRSAIQWWVPQGKIKVVSA